MPFDESPQFGPQPQPQRPVHKFDGEVHQDICMNCGLTFDTYVAAPDTPCNLRDALLANAKQKRVRDEYEARRNERRQAMKFSRGGNLDGNGDGRG